MAEAIGVVGLFSVNASGGAFEFALVVIAVVAHVPGVVFFTRVLADEDLVQLAKVDGCWLYSLDQGKVLV